MNFDKILSKGLALSLMGLTITNILPTWEKVLFLLYGLYWWNAETL